MITLRSTPITLPIVAGAFAFLFASIPLTLGKDIHDRQQADPQAQGFRRDKTLAERVKDSLAAAESLSDQARNVKVITTNGNIILKGNVTTPLEKARVQEIAQGVSKDALIENDLKVYAE